MAPISAATNERTNQPPKNGGLKTGAGPLLLLLCPGNCLCGCGHLLKRTLGPLLNQCTRDITTEASETYTRSGLCKNNCQSGQKKNFPPFPEHTVCILCKSIKRRCMKQGRIYSTQNRLIIVPNMDMLIARNCAEWDMADKRGTNQSSAAMYRHSDILLCCIHIPFACNTGMPSPPEVTVEEERERERTFL